MSGLADEVWERGDGVGSGDGESVAEICEEGDAALHAGLHEAEQDVAGIPACVADSSAGDLALGDIGADVVFGAVGIERDLGAVEHPQELMLAAMKPLEKPVEPDVAGSSSEDALETGAQDGGPSHTRTGLIALEVAVEPPDQLAHELDRLALLRGGRHQLVDEPFGMDPAQGMIGDPELPSDTITASARKP